LLYVAVASCKNQTHRINRIIIVDDGSDPKVVENNLSNFRGDSQVIYLENVHTGIPGIGRAKGLEESTSTWVAFLDSDDYWSESKIMKQLEVANATKADLVFTNAHKFGESQGAFHEEIPATIDFKELVKSNWIINSSVLVKRDVLTKTGYADSARVRAVEDYATWLRVASVGKIVGIDEILTSYRVASGTIRSKDLEDPRIHAFADYLMWSQNTKLVEEKNLKKYRKKVVRMIKSQYE
jgi:glycosyltransferase involved in cell wall biosynthesis